VRSAEPDQHVDERRLSTSAMNTIVTAIAAMRTANSRDAAAGEVRISSRSPRA
jgi:hypothetical protein